MNILNLDHPEIMEYIEWKKKEEEKVFALGKMGYSTQMEGEAYDTVSGQNSNNSVRITDNFMQSLGDKNAVWQLTGRVDSAEDKTVLVSRVRQDDPSAVWCRILVFTLGDLCFLLRVAEVLDEALFLRLNVIPCFIAATHISHIAINIMPQYDTIPFLTNGTLHSFPTFLKPTHALYSKILHF
jgi:hypothetical protein